MMVLILFEKYYDIKQKSNIFSKNAEYIPKEMGTILAEDFIIKEFNQRGWKWGGN